MKIKINYPCPENWNAMQDSPQGKFCEICSKCVVDFTNKTDHEITEIFADAKGKEVCGRIPVKSLSKMAAGIILITNLTFVQAQVINTHQSATEHNISAVTKLSGKLSFKRTKQEISNAEVFFICKKKYFKTLTDEKGNFVLEIPNEFIEKRNVLYFDFEKLNEETRKNPNRKMPNLMSGDIYERTSIFFTKNEKISDKEFQIDAEHSYIGGAVIMMDPPPDYYYFNGKSISERKFEKLKEENPNYQYFFFKGKEAEVIAKKSYLETLQLLFSN